MAIPIVKLTPSVRRAQRQLCDEISVFRQRLMRAGLLVTFHAMERAVVTIGYEIGALEDGTWPESAQKAVEERFADDEKTKRAYRVAKRRVRSRQK